MLRNLDSGVGAYRLIGLDPDQLSLQAPFPEGLAAPMAGSPMARQLVPGSFMLRSGRPACGPISLLAQEAGGPQLRPQVALLFASSPQYLVGFVFFGERPQEQKDVKKEAFDFVEVSIRVRVISWALGECLRQCPQCLVVEPTGGVKRRGPFLVR